MYHHHSRDGREGSGGFSGPISHHFCDQCNRLRLTAEGTLRSCLLNDTERGIKTLLRGRATDEELMAVIRNTVVDKPKGHQLQQRLENGQTIQCPGQMSRIGG